MSDVMVSVLDMRRHVALLREGLVAVRSRVPLAVMNGCDVNLQHVLSHKRLVALRTSEGPELEVNCCVMRVPSKSCTVGLVTAFALESGSRIGRTHRLVPRPNRSPDR